MSDSENHDSLMSEDTVWLARKTPGENPASERIFRAKEDARLWLTREIEAEPEVESYREYDSTIGDTDTIFQVVEGVPLVAGYLTEHTLARGFDDD